MKIGILLTGHTPEPLAEKHGNYAVLFDRLLSGFGFQTKAYAVVDMEFPESVSEMDGWLLSGSAHGAYEDHPFIAPLEDFIRQAWEANVPMVGICFGHQIMAQALGGRVEKYSGGWGVGANTYRTTDGREITINAMHQDQVVEKPQAAEVILSNDFCTNAGLAYKGAALSFQPHPEFNTAFMQDLIEFKRGKGLPLEKADEALSHLRKQTDAPVLARQIGEFFLRYA